MKKIVSYMVFGIALAAPMLSSAANVTQDLGTIVQGSTFQATHTNETFTDTFNLTIAPNSGIGAAAINFSFVGASQTTFTTGTLRNVATNALVNYTIRNGNDDGDGAITNRIVANFGTLAAGAYQLVIGGVATLGTSSYNGNWTVIAPSAVPVPAAVWLFGSALIGLMGVSGRKKS